MIDIILIFASLYSSDTIDYEAFNDFYKKSVVISACEKKNLARPTNNCSFSFSAVFSASTAFL